MVLGRRSVAGASPAASWTCLSSMAANSARFCSRNAFSFSCKDSRSSVVRLSSEFFKAHSVARSMATMGSNISAADVNGPAYSPPRAAFLAPAPGRVLSVILGMPGFCRAEVEAVLPSVVPSPSPPAKARASGPTPAFWAGVLPKPKKFLIGANTRAKADCSSSDSGAKAGV